MALGFNLGSGGGGGSRGAPLHAPPLTLEVAMLRFDVEFRAVDSLGRALTPSGVARLGGMPLLTAGDGDFNLSTNSRRPAASSVVCRRRQVKTSATGRSAGVAYATPPVASSGRPRAAAKSRRKVISRSSPRRRWRCTST